MYQKYVKSFQIQSISKCLSWRGGGYDKGVYTFGHEDVEFERQLLNPEVYELNVAHFEESPQLLRNAISAQMRSIRTNGDGACGVHALFGSPELAINGGYELFAQNARVIAVEHMGHSLEMLDQNSDIQKHVRDIKTILWDEFVERHLNASSTPESQIFWRSLERHTPILAREAKLVTHNNCTAKADYEQAKIQTKQASRAFFNTDIEVDIIRPLAVRLGYIPADVDVLHLSDADRAYHASVCHEDNFLKEACQDGFVRGTRFSFPLIGPSCKYSALF